MIPALIRECVEAVERGDPEIVAWGDGSPTREFLYAEDAAEGVLLATERYNDSRPVNPSTPLRAGPCVGSFVVEKLQARGATEVFVPRIEEYDRRKPSVFES